jgi:hypothetical protein
MADVVSTPSSQAPRVVGHGLSVFIGLASLVGGIAGLIAGLPTTMSLTLLAIGLLVPTLAVVSLQHSRAAWSFLIATLAVFATVTFFGAPKIRHVMGVNLAIAMIIPTLQVVAVIALASLRSDYHNRA